MRRKRIACWQHQSVAVPWLQISESHVGSNQSVAIPPVRLQLARTFAGQLPDQHIEWSSDFSVGSVKLYKDPIWGGVLYQVVREGEDGRKVVVSLKSSK